MDRFKVQNRSGLTLSSGEVAPVTENVRHPIGGLPASNRKRLLSPAPRVTTKTCLTRTSRAGSHLRVGTTVLTLR